MMDPKPPNKPPRKPPLPSEPPPPSFAAVDRTQVVRFGRYELIGELATGGMGTVYLARMAGVAGFQRLYALKLMHEHLAKERELVAMLLDEAHIASRLHHPNVVPIIDLGQDNGRLYLVMDYVEGCSLSQLCRRNRKERPPRLTVPLMLDLLAGLHAAHQLTDDEGEPLGLVHRDVSTQNVMVGVDGTARVIDFGIAKAESRITSTRPGMLKGKLAYMAPEQLTEGHVVDHRADIFAAGAVLWSVLTGQRLFKGDCESRTIANVLQKDVVAPSQVGFKPPAIFDAICLRALARKRADRYQSAEHMANDLRQAALGDDCLAPRHEIAAWVKRTFDSELDKRRDAIRARSTAAALRASLSEIDDLGSLPSLTTLRSDGAMTPLTPSSSARTLSQARNDGAGAKRRRWIGAAAILLLAGGVAAWQMRGGRSGATAEAGSAAPRSPAAPPTAQTPDPPAVATAASATAMASAAKPAISATAAKGPRRARHPRRRQAKAHPPAPPAAPKSATPASPPPTSAKPFEVNPYLH